MGSRFRLIIFLFLLYCYGLLIIFRFVFFFMLWSSQTTGFSAVFVGGSIIRRGRL